MISSEEIARSWKPGEITDVLCECGSIALDKSQRYQWKLKPDGSLVTAVDVRNEAILREALTGMIPGSHFLGEETIDMLEPGYIAEAMKGFTWIVDPIDGTAPYTHGFSSWAISIGLMADGVLVEGAVIMPEQHEILMTIGDDVAYSDEVYLNSKETEVAYKFGRLIQPPDKWDAGGVITLGQCFVRTHIMDLLNPTIVTGSAVTGIAAVLTGKAMMLCSYMKLWDVAAVLPMMKRLNVQARFPDGAPMNTIAGNGAFILEEGNPLCWYVKDEVTIARPGILNVLDTNFWPFVK